MHAIFVAMVLAAGSGQEVDLGPQRNLMNAQAMEARDQRAGALADTPGPYHYDPPRDPQEADGLICGFFKYCRAWFQPMPQTCYSPRFGCYPGNGRDFHRYPAFHGNYYRQGYNYRTLLEYPWQAGMHEPLPMEISSERSVAGMPQPSPQHAEVIETPSPVELH